jgi:sulfotransferase
MKKQFFFLTGMPRTGNTLLSVLLNQNPNIRVTANSIIPDILYYIDNLKNTTFYKNFPLQKNLNNVLKNIFDNFYFNWKSQYVIDRGPWGTVINMNILKRLFKDNIKMIVLRRPFLEVLASYVKIVNPIDIEKFCDEMMSNEHSIIKKNGFIYTNMKKEKKIKFHIVEYDDLVNKPKETLDKIYTFLNIPKYKHYFKNLNQFNIDGQHYDDTIHKSDFDKTINFHKIRTKKIIKNNYSYKDILPNSVIEKYKDVDKEIYNEKISNFNSR